MSPLNPTRRYASQAHVNTPVHRACRINRHLAWRVSDLQNLLNGVKP